MSLSQKQKKVQRSKDNKAIQQEAMKNNKKEQSSLQPVALPIEKPKEVQIKKTTKGNKLSKKYADKEIDDNLFSAYKMVKPKKPSDQNDDKLDEIM